MKKVCIVGASGKLGRYLVRHALDRGYEVVGVCRSESASKLDEFKKRISVFAGRTNDRQVVEQAVPRCDGGLTELVPYGRSTNERRAHSRGARVSELHGPVRGRAQAAERRINADRKGDIGE